MFDGEGDNDSETEAGFNVLVGAETPKGCSSNSSSASIDSPDFKFGVGLHLAMT